jgi:hypothetical protein
MFDGLPDDPGSLDVLATGSDGLTSGSGSLDELATGSDEPPQIGWTCSSSCTRIGFKAIADQLGWSRGTEDVADIGTIPRKTGSWTTGVSDFLGAALRGFPAAVFLPDMVGG